MKQIHTITAILLAIKEFGTDKFSIWNVTRKIRERLDLGFYELTHDGGCSTFITVDHSDIKEYFEELWDNGLLSNYDKSFNSQGYREYQLNDVFDDLDDSGDLAGQPLIPLPKKTVPLPIKLSPPTVTLTANDIKNACASSSIPFDVQKKMYSYIKNNGPVTMKQIQSRLKAPFTCSELKDFLAKINLIDPNTAMDYPSHVKTVKFN